MNSSCEDSFNRLPDDVVLSIFEKLQDAKWLCLSMSVCRRFHSIAPQVVDIYLPVPHQKEPLKTSFLKSLLKPFHLISHMIKPKPKPKNDHHNNHLHFYSHYLPNQILKPFHLIRALHLKLPCNGYQKPGPKSKTGEKTTALLKWKADFGRELHGCVILGARSWSASADRNSSQGSSEQDYPTAASSRCLSEDELKLRIVWTISCLIAASARHYLVGETVRALHKVEDVEVSDESDQGRLCMNRDGISEMKGKGDNTRDGEVSEYRSRVPALRMKMWFLERVEAAGKVMEGATLVVIRPTGGSGGGDDGDMVAGAFGGDKGIDEAFQQLMARFARHVGPNPHSREIAGSIT